ncbi:thiamine pyrophosphate-dependent acetolactate synthase large subunit-like protein [Shinella sp. BE166]|uniref:thiamine pyrophosphate-binding protein n=1 Tax=Shinella sp. BE166 TaxID=3373918 RepID=UPI003EB79588
MDKFDRPIGLETPSTLDWKSDIAAEMLRRLDIPYVALNPGASYRGFHDSLVNYLGNRSPQMLLCLHEDHVISIAHGYAKVTDKPMGAVLHSNVGLLHGLMGIFNAWGGRAPMIVIGATGPVEPEKRRPYIDWIHTSKDQGGLLRNYVKWDDEPRSADGIVEAFLRGHQITASTPRGPVYICLDAGLQEDPAPEHFHIPTAERYQPISPACATQRDIDAVADLVRAARNPLFLFGRGSVDQGDWDRRVALVEAAGAYVMTSTRGKAVFPTDHPRHAAPPLTWLDADAKPIVEAADLIVSFDWVDLNGLLRQVNRKSDQLEARIVHVTQDRSLHNGWDMGYFGLPPADFPIDANPDAFVAQLLVSLNGRDKGISTWTGIARIDPGPAEFNANGDREIIPFDLEVAVKKIAGSRKVTLANNNIGWSTRAFMIRGPLDFMGHNGGGGIGAGPGLTVGVALALLGSDRTVVGVMGDGDFLQGVTALWTAAHYQIPALFIVANNRSNYNDEIHQAAMAKDRGRPPENRWIGQQIDNPALDLAGMARAQGVEAEGPVENVNDLMAAIERGLAVVDAGRPYLIDAHIALGYTKKIVTRGH